MINCRGLYAAAFLNCDFQAAVIPEEGAQREACDGEPMGCRHSPITSGLSAGLFVCHVAEGLQSPGECNTGLALKQVAMLPGRVIGNA